MVNGFYVVLLYLIQTQFNIAQGNSQDMNTPRVRSIFIGCKECSLPSANPTVNPICHLGCDKWVLQKYLPCGQCYGHLTNPSANPMCKYGCNKFYPVKQLSCNDCYSYSMDPTANPFCKSGCGKGFIPHKTTKIQKTTSAITVTEKTTTFHMLLSKPVFTKEPNTKHMDSKIKTNPNYFIVEEKSYPYTSILYIVPGSLFFVLLLLVIFYYGKSMKKMNNRVSFIETNSLEQYNV